MENNNQVVVVKTPNKGKRKIPIEPITNKTRKQVTFSKRRGGLFKKGSELCSLCGAEVAIITFSGAGKFFGFGHPSADAVIQRYINSSKENKPNFTCHDNNNNNRINNNRNINDITKLSKDYKDVIGQIESEKRASSSNTNTNNNNNYSNNINFNNNNNVGKFNWLLDVNIDDLGMGELEHFKGLLEGLRNEVVTRVDEINHSSMMSGVGVPQNIDFGNRDGNIVAHGYGFDNGVGNYWIDNNGLVRDTSNFYPIAQPLHVESLYGMLQKCSNKHM